MIALRGIRASRAFVVSAVALLGVISNSHAGAAAIPPTDATCAQRVNDSAAKLVQCIRRNLLWEHMVAFQHIATANPGSDGHGNRDTGEPGYKASVRYVAALVARAGYHVTIQAYVYTKFEVVGVPRLSVAAQDYAYQDSWYVARLSGSGRISAPAQPLGLAFVTAGDDAQGGCLPSDYVGFVPGHVALLPRAACSIDTLVLNAEAAGAAGVIIYNDRAQGRGYRENLTMPARIPVVAVASYEVGANLLRQYATGRRPIVHLDIATQTGPGDIDYNLIAESRYGNSKHVVVVDAHLDAIYGAGMLDNASGSTTILEIALKLAKTQTHNRLRFIWFGGEELGLLGSHYYTQHLTSKELRRIDFDIDADVTATPNYDIVVADPRDARDARRFPPNVVPDSKIGTEEFSKYFSSVGLISYPASFGNGGTDSNSFSLVGVPNTGILTQQDCCKSEREVEIWGGVRGNYEGKIPSFNGGCVDQPHRWCDNLYNNDPLLLEVVTKAVAYVTFYFASHAFH
jgi:hypothetical protein